MTLNKKNAPKRLISCGMVFLLIMGLFVSCMTTSDEDNDNKKLNKIRVGVLYTYEYAYFRDEMLNTGIALENKQVIDGLTIGMKYSNTPGLWRALCATKSESIQFDEDVCYNYQDITEKEKKDLLSNQEIDLLLVYGTNAGTYMTLNAEKVNYDFMVFAAVDPVVAKIIPDTEGRFTDNSFAAINMGGVSRQVEAAWDILKFKKLGVVYENTLDGYSYSGIDVIKELGEKHGFTLTERYVIEAKSNGDYDRYYRDLKAAYNSLIGKVDALYITTATIEDEYLPWLLEDIQKAGIYTFSETSTSQVNYGVMLHIPMTEMAPLGDFDANTIIEYASGTPVKDLEQKYEIPPRIIINRQTIERCHAKLPMSVYLIADTVVNYTKPGVRLK